MILRGIDMGTTRFPNTTKIGNKVFWVPSSSTNNMAPELEEVVVKNPGCVIHVSGDEILLEGFGTGNKYVCHSGIIDCKTVDSTAAATATLSKESGSTTFTNITAVATVTL